MLKEKTTVETDDDGNETVIVDKSVTDYLIAQLNSYAQEKQGYILFPTVKASNIKASYFPNTDVYSVLMNKVLDYGVIGIYGWYDSKSSYNYYYYLISDYINNYYAVLNISTQNYVEFFESMSSSHALVKRWTYSTEPSSSSSSNGSSSKFYGLDTFNYYLNTSSSSSVFNSLFRYSIIVSLTGFSFPVFNSLSDAVDYLMDNGIYYTSSDYTGVGSDVTLSSDTINNIYNNDYSKLYDYVINNIDNSITNNEGDNITYEEITNIVNNTYANMDEILGSLDNIDDDINSGNADIVSALSKILTSLDDFKSKFVSQSTILSTISDKLDDILDVLKSIRNWTIADTVTDLADTIADWLQFLNDFFNDVESGVALLASGFSTVADTLITKFPFSIPWDIAFLIAFLAETPATPVFELPLSFPTYGIDYTFVIDFSQFVAVSKVSRLLLTIIFIFGLLKLTSNIIQNKK